VKKTGSTSSSMVLQIFQFKAPYQLSEVTVEMQSRISTAVANMLGVNSIDVVLTFVPATLDRRSRLNGQPTGVLVSASVTDVELSAACYISKVTQDRFNKEMIAMGLNYGQLIPATGMSHCDEYTSSRNLFVVDVG
jgi:hypothetical protein